MSKIPPFSEAVSKLRGFLASRDHPTELAWVFREDCYSLALDRWVVVQPLPEANERLARTYYESARERGVVQLRALFRIGDATAAAVWSPAEIAREVEGWPRGLKLSAAEPFVPARTVTSRFAWWLHRWTRAYRLNQARGFDVPRRAALGRPTG